MSESSVFDSDGDDGGMLNARCTVRGLSALWTDVMKRWEVNHCFVSTSLRWCHAGIKRVIKVYGAIIECEKRSCSVVLKIEIFLVRAKIDFLIAFLQS